MSLVQKPAPDFRAECIMPDGETKEISLSSFKGKNYVVLFFYPLDFTFVCPTEILAFSHRIEEFEKRGVQVLGVERQIADLHDPAIQIIGRQSDQRAGDLAAVGRLAQAADENGDLQR